MRIATTHCRERIYHSFWEFCFNSHSVTILHLSQGVATLLVSWAIRHPYVAANEGQLAQWMEELSQFDMSVLHRPGKYHINADALSRIPDRSCHVIAISRAMSFTWFPCQSGRRFHRAYSRYCPIWTSPLYTEGTLTGTGQ